MTKRNAVVIGAVVAALFVAGGLYASNMGFKLNYALTDGGASGTNSLALPYNPQTSITSAADLEADIEATNGAGGNEVASISRFLSATDTLQTYAGQLVTNDFNLVAAEGLRIQMNTGINYLVVGSHDPALVVSLDALGTNGSASGTNSFGTPYHTTASDAAALEAEIEAAAGGIDAVASISRFVNATDTLQTYAGQLITNSFGLTPGEALRIQMNNDVAYVPSHF